MFHCAIPGCREQESHLRSGSLQLLDVRIRGNRAVKKLVWFCAGCTGKYVVQGWRPAGEQIRLRKADSSFSLADILPGTMASLAVGKSAGFISH